MRMSGNSENKRSASPWNGNRLASPWTSALEQLPFDNNHETIWSNNGSQMIHLFCISAKAQHEVRVCMQTRTERLKTSFPFHLCSPPLPFTGSALEISICSHWAGNQRYFLLSPPPNEQQRSNGAVRLHSHRQHRSESHRRCCFSLCRRHSVALSSLATSESNEIWALKTLPVPPLFSHRALLLHHPPLLSLNFLLVDREGISLT